MFKVKYNPDGFMTKFKVRLVAPRFLQIPEDDFVKTFISIVRKKSLHIYLALYFMLNLFIHQIDIVGAYLESLLGDNNLPIFIKLHLDI